MHHSIVELPPSYPSWGPQLGILQAGAVYLSLILIQLGGQLQVEPSDG